MISEIEDEEFDLPLRIIVTAVKHTVAANWGIYTVPEDNDAKTLNAFERIDAVLFDPEINMRPKLAALVALRRENNKIGTSWASNVTYAAAVGSTDPRAGGRARQAAIEEGLISATSRPGREPIVRVNYQRIYSIHDRLNAERDARCAKRIYSREQLSQTPANSHEGTPAISGDRPPIEAPAISGDTTPANSHEGTPAISDDPPLPFHTSEPARNRQLNQQENGREAHSAQSPPLAGASSFEKGRADNGSSESPPTPQQHVAAATKLPVRVGAATRFGSDLNNLNPHAASVRHNRRYGALSSLDGSEGVVFDIQLGRLSLVNGTLAHFEQEAKARGLDLSAALVKAAVKVAKDPRNATPTMVAAEINQALAYQEADKRKAPAAGGLRFNRSNFGRGGIRQL
ncbi:hypothetical protein [Hyphomicrobium sp.]|uniref:hypothetical protein n=1 Tax=Hyphomicrobium sp. TaxID=82 RepID=UPI000F9B5B29|nr:hypothetical protein [Hyphomicrobium sp.]RUO98950.1 MAG: hypothetical protein EKK30_08840 [Hyphomicrobium sp.]